MINFNLTTERLVLRLFVKEDIDDLYDYLSDAEVLAFEPYDAVSYERCKEELESRVHDKRFLAVMLKESDKVIGNLYINQIEPEFIHTFEIGYVFNRKFHGNGYATEAVTGLLEHLFRVEEAHRVIAFCNALNEPSWQLLERIRMRREAHRVKNMYFKKDESGSPIWFDSFQYAILGAEWEKKTVSP